MIMKKFVSIVLIILTFGTFTDVMAQEKADSVRSFPLVNYIFKADRNNSPSVDHSKFEILNQDFEDAHQLTAACLSCHTERDKEIMATSHWKWEREDVLKGKGRVKLGKKNIINNFCIGISGSEATCTRCHIGYGWKDKNFDFTEPTNIDCVVCHDQTDTYKKGKGMAGLPDPSVNLSYVAQNVGIPRQENCGVCHFWGGGGNNVKHGDLDVAMLDCSREVDVHMASEGEDMSCVECHKTEKHQMAGRVYALSSENKNRATCIQCHTPKPHQDEMLNDHNIRIACQTCHIPVYAKQNATKMWWDWSSAGKLDEHGKPMHENDAYGNHNYLSIKGNFVYDDWVKPEYYWFNGLANHQLITDKIESVPVQMNSLYGSYRDKGENQASLEPSKIWPVKVHRGKQVYDTINMTLIQPKLWDKEKGKGAYWTDFDWEEANRLGMEYVGKEYSGAYGFIETEMYWPLNHQVSPADKALKCVDCHQRKDSRLAGLTDFYLPGRDRSAFLDGFGVIAVIGSIIGVFAHSILRRIMRRKCFFQKESNE